MENNKINNIKDLRYKFSMTQKEFAEALGISERNARDKENGNAPFTQYEMIKIMFMFNLSKKEFYKLFVENCNNYLLINKNCPRINNK